MINMIIWLTPYCYCFGVLLGKKNEPVSLACAQPANLAMPLKKQ